MATLSAFANTRRGRIMRLCRHSSANVVDIRSVLARGPGCLGSQRALRLCGLCAAESPAATGTSTANWRGTFSPPGI